MRRLWIVGVTVLAAGFAVACADTDVESTQEAQEELETDDGRELNVTPVDLESQRWFQEGRTVEFGGRSWLVTGEPIYDPAVTPVGEFEGMTLFAETGTTGPYSELFIPLEDDYWQRLTPTDPSPPGASDVPGSMGEVEETPGT